MGAWTSPFMIGITSTSFSPLAYIPTFNEGVRLPNQPFARMSGLEPETPSFGD